MQRTLVIIKYDGVYKGLTPHDIVRDTDLTTSRTKYVIPTIELSRKHYSEHEGKPHFERITKALCKDYVIYAIVTGNDAIARVRNIIGTRDKPDTIRGKYSNPDVLHENAVHASDSVESAEREIALWY